MFSINCQDNFCDFKSYFFPKSEGKFLTLTNSFSFSSEVDGGPVVRTFDDFTVGAGTVVTTSNRCRGLYLNILGDCKIDRHTLHVTTRPQTALENSFGINPSKRHLLRW